MLGFMFFYHWNMFWLYMSSGPVQVKARPPQENDHKGWMKQLVTTRSYICQILFITAVEGEVGRSSIKIDDCV